MAGRILKACLRGLAVMCMVSPAMAADLTAFTEEWAPYNYSDNGKIKGISTDMLKAACEAARLHCEIRMVPWARAYKVVQSTPNTLLFTTARKPSRENDFLWVGPILPRTTWVYGRAGLERTVRDFQELSALRIGVVREEAARQDLEAAGVPPSALVEQASNADVLRLLASANVDAMVETEVGMQWSLRKRMAEPVPVVKLMKLSDGGAYYFALNLKSDPAMVKILQSAMDRLRRNGQLQAIVARYADR